MWSLVHISNIPNPLPYLPFYSLQPLKHDHNPSKNPDGPRKSHALTLSPAAVVLFKPASPENLEP